MPKITKEVKVRNQSKALMVTIPTIFINALDIKENDKVSFSLDGERLVLDVIKNDNTQEDK